ncbi:lipid IV(A) 3-deoxy-D-manno-octulosonic acid transferase [Legionella sp. W05-934-2]|uniref:lipid IV(A) 3-deoxy-D-manno-octulosonic acid transferase n=1 Tax=Legionella sp. W05-934-2 TaxID=1198649 RepID=UPI003462608D
MHHLYNLFLRLAMPFVFLRLFVKSRKLPAYRYRIGERFSRQANLRQVDIWIHAVSLGEVIAVSPLINVLLEKGYQLMVTTTTPTGSKKLMDMFQGRIQHQYLPYDLPTLQYRFLQKIKPKLIVLMETEIWPNLVGEAKKMGVKIAIINARLSERSMHGYGKIARLIAPVLQSVDAILAQSDTDAHRFRRLANHPSKPVIEVLGNIKFDQPMPADKDNLPMQTMQKQWGKDRPVLILASTHDDEERQILNHISTIKAASPHVLILVVPRHPERFHAVFEQIRELGLVTYKRSEPDKIQSNAEVIVIDCVGELMQWYSLAKVAFVGGSLVPVGGHNVLEPAMLGIPVLTGPHMHNFTHIAQMLHDRQAMILANTISEVIESVVRLLNNEEDCQQIAKAATQVLVENRGAIHRYLEWIAREINEPSFQQKPKHS